MIDRIKSIYYILGIYNMLLIVSGLFSLEKRWKNLLFSGLIQPDWRNTTRVATTGFGSI